jgi:hypothetical protein
VSEPFRLELRGVSSGTLSVSPFRRRTRPAGRLRLPLLAFCCLLAGCGSRGTPEVIVPGWERGTVPGFQGERVLLLPVQDAGGVGEFDRELEYALRARSPEIQWVGTATIERLAGEAGRLGADPSDLPVGAFEQGRLDRVGDPLYGALYRLAAFGDARFALLPLSTRREPTEDGRESVTVDVLLLEPRTGRVLWQGLVRGEGAAPGTPASAASAAERVAAKLVP